VLLGASTVFPWSRLGSEFMPPLDEGDLLYMPTTDPAISITLLAPETPSPPSPLHPELFAAIGSVSAELWPGIPILVSPTRVQGAGAEREIAAALDLLGERAGVSLVLLVRGGGSLEDLQPFNTEEVARAVLRCPVPVVSGVGHEVDVTIADLVADLRAPTPSAAAELALPDRAALRAALRARWLRLARAARTRVGRENAHLDATDRALRARSPLARLGLGRERLRAALRHLEAAVRVRSERGRRRLGETAARLDALSPLAVLDRGYGLVRRARDGGIVREAGDVEPGEVLAIRLARAELTARVETRRDRPRG